MKPNYISDSDWQFVNSICDTHPEEPLMVASIGWHETKWGTVGIKRDFICGYAYFGGGRYLAKYKGFENNIKGTHAFIKKHMKFPVTLESLTDFAVNHWKSSVPTGWAKGVYKQFKQITTMNTIDYLTPNFRLKEFACKDGTPVPLHLIDNARLVATELQKVRDYFGKPIRVNSGYRTPEYNKKVGGSPTSYHLLMLAADTKPLWDIPIDEYYRVVKKLTNFMGYGIGTTFLHTDLRKDFTVWIY